MKYLIGVVCILCFGLALAAKRPAPAPAPAPVLPHLDVKGVSPGGTFEEWKQTIGDAKYSCNPITDSSGITSDCHMEGAPNCSQIGAKTFCTPTPKYDTFAGHEVLFHYKFHDDELWHIEVWGIMPAAFDDVVEAMQSKYGKAKVTTSDIQNRMGAHFQDATAIWTGENGVIVYTKYTSQLNLPSPLTFYSTNGWKAVEEGLRDKAKAAENDM